MRSMTPKEKQDAGIVSMTFGMDDEGTSGEIEFYPGDGDLDIWNFEIPNIRRAEFTRAARKRLGFRKGVQILDLNIHGDLVVTPGTLRTTNHGSFDRTVWVKFWEPAPPKGGVQAIVKHEKKKPKKKKKLPKDIKVVKEPTLVKGVMNEAAKNPKGGVPAMFIGGPFNREIHRVISPDDIVARDAANKEWTYKLWVIDAVPNVADAKGTKVGYPPMRLNYAVFRVHGYGPMKVRDARYAVDKLGKYNWHIREFGCPGYDDNAIYLFRTKCFKTMSLTTAGGLIETEIADPDPGKKIPMHTKEWNDKKFGGQVPPVPDETSLEKTIAGTWANLIAECENSTFNLSGVKLKPVGPGIGMDSVPGATIGMIDEVTNTSDAIKVKGTLKQPKNVTKKITKKAKKNIARFPKPGARKFKKK